MSANDTLKYSTEQFDKNIVFIASGALGVSFAFIKDIVPDLQNAVCKGYLVWSWYIFAGVIFASLVGHFISMMANSWASRSDYLKDEEFNRIARSWNLWIRGLNISMIIANFIGALSLINFIHQNLKL